MTLQPRGFVVDERVPCVHHGQVVEEDHVAGLQLDTGGIFHSNVMQGVEGPALNRCKGWQGGRAVSRGRAGDASTRAIDKDPAWEVIWEGDGAGVEGPRGGRALKKTISVQIPLASTPKNVRWHSM